MPQLITMLTERMRVQRVVYEAIAHACKQRNMKMVVGAPRAVSEYGRKYHSFVWKFNRFGASEEMVALNKWIEADLDEAYKNGCNTLVWREKPEAETDFDTGGGKVVYRYHTMALWPVKKKGR